MKVCLGRWEMNFCFVKFREGDFVVKNLDSERELEQAYRLRYDIFCLELKWVSARDDGREIDAYDNHSMSLGVFTGEEELIGFVRLIYSYMPMMIEKEFLELVSPSHNIRKERDTVEVTRLSVKQPMRKGSKRQAAMALYKGIYLWSVMNGVRYLYLVVEKRSFRLFKIMGFPCRRIGPIKVLEGGVESLAALMDWRDFEKNLALCSPFLQSNHFQFNSLCHGMPAGNRV